MSVLVSVVVPAYNVERFLPKCVDSLLRQTYDNLEIIIVDDGSTDRTGEIADQYASEYEKIRCIHKGNGGLSDARNTGLAHAKGEYIVFFDSDDWVESNVIEDNLHLMIKKDVEVVVWGYHTDFVDDYEVVEKSIHVSCSDMLCQKNKNPEAFLQDNVLGLVGYAWNKMYSMKLLKDGGFTFTKGLSLVEDIVFNVPVLIAAEKVYFNGSVYTHYMQRGRVTLGNRYYDNFLELKLLACDKRKELLIGFGLGKQRSENALWANYFYGFVSTIRMINRQENLDIKAKIEMTKTIVNKWLKSSRSKKIQSKDLRTRILFRMFRFRLYKTILRVIK